MNGYGHGKGVNCPHCGAYLVIQIFPREVRMVFCPRCKFNWEVTG